MSGLLTVAVALRVFYVSSAAAILVVCLTPALRSRYLAYGARDVGGGLNIQATSPSARLASVSRLLDRCATLTVPHSWFFHFYLVSIASSLSCYYLFSGHTSTGWRSCIYWSWLCMLIQGTRRLYECLALSKASESRMWIGHYLIGIAFYVATNISIWTDHDASDEVLLPTPSSPSTNVRAVLATLFLLVASISQHISHSYLFSLKKYTLPSSGLFGYIIAPHYTAECVIYASLAVLDAPVGFVFNPTLACALVFVVVNLGVTAEGTKAWMLAKFTENRRDILQRWRMIPLLW